MATIIAAHFQTQDECLQACSALQAAGFAEDRVSTFYANPPGQHAVIPTGGDRVASPGAQDTPEGLAKGEVTGAAVGAALGAATIPLAGPVGPVLGGLVGAHVGSLYSFSELKEQDESGPPPRQAGMLVAVAATGAEGMIAGGDWKDFDPLSVPQFL